MDQWWERISHSCIQVVTGENKKTLADILAVLGMVTATETRESLKFKLQGHSNELGEWGHEFVRHLAGEVGQEYEARTTADPPQSVEDLMNFVKIIVPFNMKHNAEAEAIDLLMEVSPVSHEADSVRILPPPSQTQQLETLPDSGLVDKENNSRVCLYLLRCADYIGIPEDVNTCLEVGVVSRTGHPLSHQRLVLGGVQVVPEAR